MVKKRSKSAGGSPMDISPPGEKSVGGPGKKDIVMKDVTLRQRKIDTSGTSRLASAPYSKEVTMGEKTPPEAFMAPATGWRGKSGSGGSTPSSRSTKTPDSPDEQHSRVRTPDNGVLNLAKKVGASLKVTKPVSIPYAIPSARVTQATTILERTQQEEELRRQLLNRARLRYIKNLKNKIFKNSFERTPTHVLGDRPAIYNSIEDAADRRANHLFHFPDTDPAVYRRQINISNVARHAPIYGF